MLTASIKETGRANIVEVGTWNGSRAIQMAETAFAAGVKQVSYVGFDTFEDGNDRSHEGHTKPHASSWIVGNRLNNYSRMMSRKGLTFDYTLLKGNTLVTLPGAGEVVKNATFAYIDGGHSYQTTRSDYDSLAHHTLHRVRRRHRKRRGRRTRRPAPCLQRSRRTEAPDHKRRRLRRLVADDFAGCRRARRL